MENKKCPNCGEEMKTTIDGSALNHKCPKCGYGEATTIAEGIEWDPREYEILVLVNEQVDINQIKAISSISCLNFIESKNLLLNGGLLEKGRATEIKKKKEVLDFNSIKYIIKPEYPY